MYKDDKGCVRTVQLYLGCSDPTKLLNRELVSPIDKTVSLLDLDEKVPSPTEELL